MNRALPKTADREALENAIQANLSPEAVTILLGYLQVASNYDANTPERQRAIREVRWFRDTLLEMLGVDEFSRMATVTGKDVTIPAGH